MMVLDVCGSSVRLSEDNGFERASTGSASWELLESTCNLIGTASLNHVYRILSINQLQHKCTVLLNLSKHDFKPLTLTQHICAGRGSSHLCIATKHNFKLLIKFGTIRNWKNIPNLPDGSQCL
ncbi:unnamed protein product [Prunus brigantina]